MESLDDEESGTFKKMIKAPNDATSILQSIQSFEMKSESTGSEKSKGETRSIGAEFLDDVDEFINNVAGSFDENSSTNPSRGCSSCLKVIELPTSNSNKEPFLFILITHNSFHCDI